MNTKIDLILNLCIINLRLGRVGIDTVFKEAAQMISLYICAVLLNWCLLEILKMLFDWKRFLLAVPSCVSTDCRVELLR